MLWRLIAIAMGTVFAVLVVISTLLTIGYQLNFVPERMKTPWVWAIVVVALLASVLKVAWPSLPSVWAKLKRVKRNVGLLLVRHDELFDRVEALHKAGGASAFAKIGDLEGYKASNYYVLYTHKDDLSTGNNNFHPPQPGPEDDYRIPGFPYDEAEAVMTVWFYAARNLVLTRDHVRPRCSCAYHDEKLKKDILDGSYAVIGSPKDNIVCNALMDRLLDLSKASKLTDPPKYVLKVEKTDEERRCYLEGGPFAPSLRPSFTTGAVDGQELEDYAIFMKLPNILGNPHPTASTVLIIAGCKVAGQFALTRWLSDSRNLIELDRKHNGKYCYAVLHVRYRFVKNRMPVLLKWEKIDDGAVGFAF